MEKRKPKKKRIVYDITPEKDEEIEKLMKKCGFNTRTEFLNVTCAVFAWIVEQKFDNRTIISRKEGDPTTIELEISSLRIGLRKRESKK